MYAIKIISDYTVFHLSEEISYRWLEYKNKDHFWQLVSDLHPTHQIGDSPKDDDSKGQFVNLILYKDGVTSKEFFIMPISWVYIMQDGQTIEAINIVNVD